MHLSIKFVRIKKGAHTFPVHSLYFTTCLPPVVAILISAVAVPVYISVPHRTKP